MLSSFSFLTSLRSVTLPLLLVGLTACAESEEPEQPLQDGGGPAVTPDSGLALDAGGGWDAYIPPVSYPDAGGDSTLPVGDARSDGTVPPSSGELCHLEGNQVGIMGDSYIQLSGDFTRDLQETARKAGALKANETYLDHSLSGASMDGFPNIPAQWPDILADAKAKMSKGVKLVIMTGGGNDVLVNNRPCLDFPTVADVTPACKKVVQTALDRSQELFDQAVKDGVKAIVFFFYPHLPGHIINGPHPNSILDYAYPEVKRQCEKQTQVPCYFIDTRPAFDNGMGLPRDGLISVFDGIHPTPEGSQIIADLVWKVMQDKCLASK